MDGWMAQVQLPRRGGENDTGAAVGGPRHSGDGLTRGKNVKNGKPNVNKCLCVCVHKSYYVILKRGILLSTKTSKTVWDFTRGNDIMHDE